MYFTITGCQWCGRKSRLYPHELPIHGRSRTLTIYICSGCGDASTSDNQHTRGALDALVITSAKLEVIIHDNKEN